MTEHNILYLSHTDVEAVILSMQDVIDLLESPSRRTTTARWRRRPNQIISIGLVFSN